MKLNKTWKRQFFTIWTGQAISLFTSSIVQYALIWHLTAKTESAMVLSIATLVGFLPTALFSPFIGSIADRYDRKKIMIFSDVGVALAALLLMVLGLMGDMSIGAIYFALFVRALGSAFQQPCVLAITPMIVPDTQLDKCGGYTQTFQSISLILSPAVASVLFAALPLPILMLLDVVGAVAGVSTLLLVKIPKLTAAAAKSNLVKEAAEGLRALRKKKGLYYLTLISALFSMAYIPVGSLYPLMTLQHFGGTPYHMGLVETLFSVGMLAGGLVLGIFGGTKDKMVSIILSVFSFGVMMVIMGLLPPTAFVLFAVLTLLTGVTAPFFSTLFMALLQQQIEGEFLGRVIGVTSSVMSLAAPVGLALSGIFAEKMGIMNWFMLSGVFTVFCAVLCVVIKPVRTADRQKT